MPRPRDVAERASGHQLAPRDGQHVGGLERRARRGPRRRRPCWCRRPGRSRSRPAAARRRRRRARARARRRRRARARPPCRRACGRAGRCRQRAGRRRPGGGAREARQPATPGSRSPTTTSWVAAAADDVRAAGRRCVREESATTRRRSAWRRQNRAHASSGCSATSSTSSCAASAASSRAGPSCGVGAPSSLVSRVWRPSSAASRSASRRTSAGEVAPSKRDEGEHGVGVDGHGRGAAGDPRGEVADQRAGRAGVGEQHVEVGPAHGVQLRVPAGAHGRVARLAGEQRQLAQHLAAARLPHHLAVDEHLQPSVPDDVQGVTGVAALEQHRARGQRHRPGERRQLAQPRVGQAGEERYLPQQRGLLVHGCDHGACQVRSSTPTPGWTRRTCTRHGSTRASTKPGAVGPSQPGTPMAPGS